MLSIAYLDVSAIDVENAKKYVSLQRLQKTEKLKSIDAKKESLGAELLLSSMLSLHFSDVSLPPKMEYGIKGKPHLTDYPQLHFNLSHSNLYVACVISDVPTGIDIQHMHKFNPDIASRFFTSDEQDFINKSSDKSRAFYEVWTKKEALLKCDGTGLCDISKKSIFDAEKEGYLFKCDYFNDYMVSVCIKEESDGS